MRWLIFLTGLVFLAGCSNDDHIPSGIIGKKDMSAILWDMIQADQFSFQYMTKDSARMNVKKETMKLYEDIFRIHHISKNEFQKSFQFYLAHPDITKVMFDSLSARGSRQRADVYKHTPKIKVK